MLLTARHMAIIATRTSVPPLHLSSLSKMYTISPFSLRSIAILMGQQKTYLEFQVRDLSLLTSVTSYAALVAAWPKSGQPSTATLQKLNSTLSGVGASVTYLSEYWHDVGIAGNTSALASIGLIRLDVLAGVGQAASGNLHASDVIPQLTADQWTKLGEFVFAIGAFACLLTPVTAIPAVVFAIAGDAALIGAILPAEWAAIGALSVSAAGVSALGAGLFQSVADNPSVAPTSLCTPSGAIINLPINPTDAGAGVMSIDELPDAYGAYHSPGVDLDDLSSSPPPTPAPVEGGPPPTPGPISGTGKESVDEGTGDEGTGDEGTGDEGTGTEGTGDEGTGDEGTGTEGTGDESTGDEGTGTEGTGDESTGDESTGQEGMSVQEGGLGYLITVDRPVWERYAI